MFQVCFLLTSLSVCTETLARFKPTEWIQGLFVLYIFFKFRWWFISKVWCHCDVGVILICLFCSRFIFNSWITCCNQQLQYIYCIESYIHRMALKVIDSCKRSHVKDQCGHSVLFFHWPISMTKPHRCHVKNDVIIHKTQQKPEDGQSGGRGSQRSN